MIWELVGYNTDSRYASDVRYRSYTNSAKHAEAFGRIPKIQFTDSGHGVVFHARPHKGKRKPIVLAVAAHVRAHLNEQKPSA